MYEHQLLGLRSCDYGQPRDAGQRGLANAVQGFCKHPSHRCRQCCLVEGTSLIWAISSPISFGNYLEVSPGRPCLCRDHSKDPHIGRTSSSVVLCFVIKLAFIAFYHRCSSKRYEWVVIYVQGTYIFQTSENFAHKVVVH